MMRPTRIRRIAALAVLGIALLALPSCATAHLLNWTVDEPSVYNQTDNRVSRAIVHPGGTVAALPVLLAWDVATFPFQMIWGVYPYGGTLSPNSFGQ